MIARESNRRHFMYDIHLATGHVKIPKNMAFWMRRHLSLKTETAGLSKTSIVTFQVTRRRVT
jgi:hypothetical protein